MERDGLTEEANKVFQAMIDAGAIEEVLKQELSSWDEPVHYVSMQHAINEGSVSTPCHLVTNSPFNDSLNGMLAKGPKVLGDMWSLLVSFRNYNVEGIVAKAEEAKEPAIKVPVLRHFNYGFATNSWKELLICLRFKESRLLAAERGISACILSAENPHKAAKS